MKSLSSLVLLLGTLGITGAKDCSCGYRDEKGNVWRQSVISDFTQGALAAVNANWQISTDFGDQSENPQATANIQYVKANVFEHNDALGMKASAYDGSGSVKSAQIVSNVRNMLYGSFRMKAGIPSVPGAVFGFFTYINDSQEQDIEFLGSDTNYYQHLHYTNQPGRTSGAHQEVEIPGADFTAIGEHRIDWNPGRTDYFYTGNVSAQHSITVNVPTTPSEFILNVWSNGDPGWSNGPPKADAIATIQRIELYFNTTSFTERNFLDSCNAGGAVPACKI